jgi:hypothetical protein
MMVWAMVWAWVWVCGVCMGMGKRLAMVGLGVVGESMVEMGMERENATVRS